MSILDGQCYFFREPGGFSCRGIIPDASGCVLWLDSESGRDGCAAAKKRSGEGLGIGEVGGEGRAALLVEDGGAGVFEDGVDG